MILNVTTIFESTISKSLWNIVAPQRQQQSESTNSISIAVALKRLAGDWLLVGLIWNTAGFIASALIPIWKSRPNSTHSISCMALSGGFGAWHDVTEIWTANTSCNYFRLPKPMSITMPILFAVTRRTPCRRWPFGPILASSNPSSFTRGCCWTTSPTRSRRPSTASTAPQPWQIPPLRRRRDLQRATWWTDGVSLDALSRPHSEPCADPMIQPPPPHSTVFLCSADRLLQSTATANSIKITH